MSFKTGVGLFLLVAFLLLAALTFLVEDMGELWSKAYRLKVRLPTADVEPGSQVKLAGVKVGVVEKTQIDPTRDKLPVLVTFRVDEGVVIYDTCKAKVVKSGLLGKAVLGIDLIHTPNSRPLKPGETMTQVGEEVSLDAVLLGAKKIVEDVSAMTDHARKGEGTIGKLVMKDEAYNKLVGAIDPFKETFENAASITTSINEGKGTIGRLVRDEDLGKRVDGAVTEFKGTFENAHKITDGIQKGEGTVGKLLKDKEMADNAKKMIASGKKTFANMADITQNIKDGKGTLGKLASDEEMAKDVKGTIKNLDDITGQIRSGKGTIGTLIYDDKLVKTAQDILDSIQAALEDLRESAPVASFAGAVLGAF